MLYAGLDLSRKRLDVHVLREDGTTALVTAVSPDTDALRRLGRRVAAEGEPVRATIESINGARFVHDTLRLDEAELAQAALEGVELLLADPARVGRIRVELVDRNELDDMGARFHAPQSERRQPRSTTLGMSRSRDV
jgi:hypothetical protein